MKQYKLYRNYRPLLAGGLLLFLLMSRVGEAHMAREGKGLARDSKRETTVVVKSEALPARKSEGENEKPETVKVVATAYSNGAQCNGAWIAQNALGGRLKSGKVNSAAADWSRFPVGTKFRVKETGKVYQVDDYGSAMVGKDKVDLFMADYGQVDRWGVRKVNLEVIEWGSHAKSLKILKSRGNARHIKKMVEGLEAKLGEA